MSITLTNSVKFVSQTDTTMSAVESTIDLLNGTAQAIQTYGTGTDAAFVPDPAAPGVNITFSLVTGAVWVNGVPFQVSGKAVSLATSDLAAIVAAFTTAQNAVDTALVNAGVFAGTVS